MRRNLTIPLLKEAYAAELETVQACLANLVWLDGLRVREVAQALEEDVTEELGQAQKLAHRLKQLGVFPPGSLELLHGQKSPQPAADSTNLRHLVEGVLDAEPGSILTRKKIIAACGDVAPVHPDLAVQILADEGGPRHIFEDF